MTSGVASIIVRIEHHTHTHTLAMEDEWEFEDVAEVYEGVAYPRLDLRELIDVPPWEEADGLGEDMMMLGETATPDKSRAPRAKKQKNSSSTTRSSHRPALPKDKNGRTIIPAQVGGITVHSLGTVVFDRPRFVNARYIFPPGFETTRIYFSPTVAEKKVTYRSRIIDGGDQPQFEVVCLEDPEKPMVWTSPTPSGAWAPAVKACNDAGSVARNSAAVR